MTTTVRSFTDLRPNPVIRSMLSAAGHAMGEWSDRQLVAVQYTAQRLAAGDRVFVSQVMQPLLDTLMSASDNQDRR